MRDKEHQKQYLRERYAKNKEKFKAYRKKYYEAHKEQYRLLAIKKRPYLHEYHKKWWAKNKDKALDRKFIQRRERRKEIFEFLGNKCTNCLMSDARVLQIDHINGNGSKERIAVGYGNFQTHQWHMFKKNPVDFRTRHQLLCANCNWIKRIEKQEQKTRKVG